MLSRGTGRSQGSTHSASPKKRSTKAAAKGMPSPKKDPVSQRHLSEQDDIRVIMDMLMDISSCLQATEYFMREAEKEKSAAIARCGESLSHGWSAACTSRGCSCLGSPVLLGLAHSSMDISESVRKKVAR